MQIAAGSYAGDGTLGLRTIITGLSGVLTYLRIVSKAVPSQAGNGNQVEMMFPNLTGDPGTAILPVGGPPSPVNITAALGLNAVGADFQVNQALMPWNELGATYYWVAFTN